MAAEPTEIDREPGLLPPANEGVEPTQASEPAPPSLRETLDAAVREARETPDAPRSETKPASQSGDDRPRGPDGKFVPKDAAPATAAAPDKSTAAQSDTPAAPSIAQAGPPTGWSTEAKALYGSLPPAIQAAVSRREAEVSAGFAQYQGLKHRHDEYERVIAPRRQYYANEGISDVQAYDNIWKWFEALRNSPQEAFPQLVKLFGIDPSTVLPSGSANPNPQNPDTTSLLQHIRRLESQVGQVTGTFEQQQMAARQQELASWSTAKDATGTPLRPHFEKVRVTMGRLMQAGVATTLDDAYQQAMRIDPGVQADEKAAAERKAAEDALTRRGGGTQRRAAVSVRGGSPNGAAGAAHPTSIRESLREGFAAARGG